MAFHSQLDILEYIVAVSIDPVQSYSRTFLNGDFPSV